MSNHDRIAEASGRTSNLRRTCGRCHRHVEVAGYRPGYRVRCPLCQTFLGRFEPGAAGGEVVTCTFDPSAADDVRTIGAEAIRLGFASRKDVQDALDEQMARPTRRTLGAILLGRGRLSCVRLARLLQAASDVRAEVDPLEVIELASAPPAVDPSIEATRRRFRELGASLDRPRAARTTGRRAGRRPTAAACLGLIVAAASASGFRSASDPLPQQPAAQEARAPAPSCGDQVTFEGLAAFGPGSIVAWNEYQAFRIVVDGRTYWAIDATGSSRRRVRFLEKNGSTGTLVRISGRIADAPPPGISVPFHKAGGYVMLETWDVVGSDPVGSRNGRSR